MAGEDRRPKTTEEEARMSDKSKASGENDRQRAGRRITLEQLAQILAGARKPSPDDLVKVTELLATGLRSTEMRQMRLLQPGHEQA